MTQHRHVQPVDFQITRVRFRRPPLYRLNSDTFCQLHMMTKAQSVSKKHKTYLVSCCGLGESVSGRCALRCSVVKMRATNSRTERQRNATAQKPPRERVNHQRTRTTWARTFLANTRMLNQTTISREFPVRHSCLWSACQRVFPARRAPALNKRSV